MAKDLPPGELVAGLFELGLCFDQIARAVTAIGARQWFPLDCEDALRRYLSRRKREGRS